MIACRPEVTFDVTNGARYHGDSVIRSFKDREAARIWRRQYSRRLPGEIQERALMKLQQLHAAGSLEDLSIPVSNQLEPLRGDLKGFHSIRVNKQWRVCFRWHAGDAWDVAITDYH